MSEKIVRLLAGIEVDEPRASAGLQVFGLRRKDGDGLHYVTLDESLAADLVEVTEVSEGGQVPQLKVVNKGDAMLFLMSGEQLIGAKQNRVLNASIMVKARSEQPIPVTCTEAGRWAYRSRKFWSSGTSSHAKLRALMSAQVQASYRSVGAPRADQAGVWDAVSEKLHVMRSFSESAALEKAYEDRSQSLEGILSRLVAPAGCSGAVFAVHGRIAGSDLFDKPATLAKLWPKLLRGYAIDALEPCDGEPVSMTTDDVREWLRTAAAAKMERFKSPGLGDDVRVQGQDLVGAALVVEDMPVHVEIFAKAADPKRR